MSFSIFGKIVLADRIVKGTIVVQSGKITNIKTGFAPSSKDIFNYEKNYILPGLIEIHGHMREPGLTQKEDIPHGTRAAIAGGFTSIIDMPNANPATVTVDLLHQKMKQLYPKRSYADYAFFMGASKDSIAELEKVDPKEIAGVKIFMAGHETTPTIIPDDETLGKIFKILGKRKILAAIHAEDQALLSVYENLYKKSGKTNPSLWSLIRKKDVVTTAVKRAIRLAEKYRVKLYLLHLSTPEEFRLVHDAKQKGVNVFGELVSYQLLFNTSDYEKLGNRIKVSPALRSKSIQDAVWKMFQNKKVDAVCSEHTPHEKELKIQDNVWKAPSGMPNIQETLPALITEWIKRFGRKNLEEGLMTIAKLSAYNPAHIFGFCQKGEIAIGKDGDFVVVDTNHKWKVKKEDLFSKCGWSAYEGMELTGRPIATFLRGELVYKNGEVLGKPKGKWLGKK